MLSLNSTLILSLQSVHRLAPVYKSHFAKAKVYKYILNLLMMFVSNAKHCCQEGEKREGVRYSYNRYLDPRLKGNLL